MIQKDAILLVGLSTMAKNISNFLIIAVSMTIVSSRLCYTDLFFGYFSLVLA